MHAQLGMIYFQQQAFARAVPNLRQALKLKPGLPNVDVLLSRCAFRSWASSRRPCRVSRRALGSFRPALRRATGLQLQRAHTGLGQDDKAVEVALQLTRLYKDDPEVLYHTGRLFSNYAYLMTMRLAEVAPTSSGMHQAAGRGQREPWGSYDAALDEYRKVLALAPDRPGIHYRMGRVFLARARPPLSEADAEARAAQEFEQELRTRSHERRCRVRAGRDTSARRGPGQGARALRAGREELSRLRARPRRAWDGCWSPRARPNSPCLRSRGRLPEPRRRRRLLPALAGAPSARPPRGAGEGAGRSSSACAPASASRSGWTCSASMWSRSRSWMRRRRRLRVTGIHHRKVTSGLRGA